jgi:hypothetical protein
MTIARTWPELGQLRIPGRVQGAVCHQVRDARARHAVYLEKIAADEKGRVGKHGDRMNRCRARAEFQVRDRERRHARDRGCAEAQGECRKDYAKKPAKHALLRKSAGRYFAGPNPSIFPEKAPQVTGAERSPRMGRSA